VPYAPLPAITEDLDDLRRRFRAARDPERKRRLHALVLLVAGEATTRKAIAERLGVDRQTVARWFDRYRDGGLGYVLTPSTRGARPGQRTVPAPVLDALKARLDDPAGFGGFHKVQLWLHDEYALDVPYKSVYTLVRYRLKAKLKVPRPEHPKKA